MGNETKRKEVKVMVTGVIIVPHVKHQTKSTVTSVAVVKFSNGDSVRVEIGPNVHEDLAFVQRGDILICNKTYELSCGWRETLISYSLERNLTLEKMLEDFKK